METPDEFARLGMALVAVADDIDATDAATHDIVRAMVPVLLRAERLVRSERSSAVLAGTHTTGTKSGRPLGRRRLEIDRDRIRVLRDQCRSLRHIGEQVGVSVTTVHRECAEPWQGARVVATPPGIGFGCPVSAGAEATMTGNPLLTETIGDVPPASHMPLKLAGWFCVACCPAYAAPDAPGRKDGGMEGQRGGAGHSL